MHFKKVLFLMCSIFILFSTQNASAEEVIIPVTAKNELQIKETLGAPTQLTLKLTSYNDILASWNEVAGADGYYVYYKKTNAENYSCQIIQTTSIQFKNRESSTQYNVKIVPYALVGEKRIKSNAYKLKRITTLEDIPAPESLTLNLIGYNDISISWSEVPGASGYYVYYKYNDTSNYSCKITETLSLSLKNRNEARLHDIKVVPYVLVNGSKVKSDHSIYDQISTLSYIDAPTTLTLNLQNAHDIQANWTSVEGADGYYVYYKESASPAYEYEIVEEPFITLKNCAEATKFNIKIVPFVIYNDAYIKSDTYKMKQITTNILFDTLYYTLELPAEWDHKYSTSHSNNTNISFFVSGLRNDASSKGTLLTIGKYTYWYDDWIPENHIVLYKYQSAAYSSYYYAAVIPDSSEQIDANYPEATAQYLEMKPYVESIVASFRKK